MGRNKNVKIGLIVLAAILVGYWIFGGAGNEEVNKTMITKVIKGDLPIEVIATGELKARNLSKYICSIFVKKFGSESNKNIQYGFGRYYIKKR